MVHPVSRDNNIVLIDHKKKQKLNKLTDRERIVYGYHYFEGGNHQEATSILGQVNQAYWTGQFHKDIARALLCQATYATTQHPGHGKESEFYVVVYRLTRHVTSNKIHFNGSGNLYLLKDELFKDLM